MAGTSWGLAIAYDTKGRNARKWDHIRNKALPGSRSKGLSGAALETAVMALAATDSSLVKIEART